MGWNDPPARAINESIRASDHNTYIRNNLLQLGRPPLFRGYRGSAYSIPHHATAWDPIEWDAEEIKVNTTHSNITDSHKVTVPDTGWYWVRGSLYMNNPNATGNRLLAIYKNESISRIGGPGIAVAGLNVAEVNDLVLCAAGDYLSLRVFNTGGAGIPLVDIAQPYSNAFTVKWECAN